MYSVPYGSWRFEAVRFPSEPSSYRSELDGQVLTLTAIASIRDEDLVGAHIVFAIDESKSWGLLTVADAHAGVSGTFYAEEGVYRLVSSPHYDSLVALAISQEIASRADNDLALALGEKPELVRVELRHQALLGEWARQR